MSGARLAYTVVELEGTVRRPIVRLDPGKGIVHEDVDVPAGYLVYFPRGHVLRFKSKEELKRYGLDRPPRVINLAGLLSSSSPDGQLLMEQDEGAREGVMVNMQNAVMQLATARSGSVIMPEMIDGKMSRFARRSVGKRKHKDKEAEAA